jgi:glucokinase
MLGFMFGAYMFRNKRKRQNMLHIGYIGGVKMETYLVAYTDKDDMEYKQVTCESYEDAERTVLRLEREGHMHIEEISNQEAYRGDESSYRE